MREVEDVGSASLLTPIVVFRLKVSGTVKAWFNRWREEPGRRTWTELGVDFPAEARRRRTFTSTLTETLAIKMTDEEETDRYRHRMELHLEFLEAIGAEEAAKTAATEDPSTTTPAFKLSQEAHSLLSQAFVKGLASGHPYKSKNRPTCATIKETIAAVMKYCQPNEYDEPTFDTRIRDKNRDAYTLVPNEVFEHNGVKIEGPKLIEFKGEFDKQVTDALSVDELTNMFQAWKLSSLEERTVAGRVMRTVSLMDATVARR
ncbi:hypothetical protein BGZ95_008207, partial [Linnemannia exigua]